MMHLAIVAEGFAVCRCLCREFVIMSIFNQNVNGLRANHENIFAGQLAEDVS